MGLYGLDGGMKAFLKGFLCWGTKAWEMKMATAIKEKAITVGF